MSDSAQNPVLSVSGMTCGHCRQAVESAIREVSGVTNVQVSLDEGTAKVEGNVDPQRLISAVLEAGYEATLCGSKK